MDTSGHRRSLRLLTHYIGIFADKEDINSSYQHTVVTKVGLLVANATYVAPVKVLILLYFFFQGELNSGKVHMSATIAGGAPFKRLVDRTWYVGPCS